MQGADYRKFFFRSPISEATSTPRKDRFQTFHTVIRISHSVRILFPRGGKSSRVEIHTLYAHGIRAYRGHLNSPACASPYPPPLASPFLRAVTNSF